MLDKGTLRWVVVGAGGILAPLFLFSSPPKPHEGDDGLGARLLHEIVYPVEFTWHLGVSGLKGAWNRYFYLVDTAAENDRLRQEINLLAIEVRDREDQARENQRLRSLLGFAERSGTDFTIAQVVGSVGEDQPFQVLRMNRGAQSGIRVGMPAVVANGVVGRVLRVGTYFSDVQLLTDPNSYVDVLIERTRTRGILRGTDSRNCRLQIHRESDVRIGDTIVSSGLVGPLPRGLPIGRIVKIAYETDHVAQDVLVEPAVVAAELEELLILHREDPEVLRIIETAGEAWLERRDGERG